MMTNAEPVWLGSVEQVKEDATVIRKKLHDIRESFKYYSNPAGNINLQSAREFFSAKNEDLYEFCSTYRRKYLEVPMDKTVVMTKQYQEDQMVIARLQADKQELERKLLEMIKAKDQALNRLSELQSRMLKYGNPEITDLSYENRPTKLGENFKQLYEDEWTDAFEFLTEKRKEQILPDKSAIDMLYNMLKSCHEVCQEAWKEQHTGLAEIVTKPTLVTPIQGEETLSLVGPQSKPPMMTQTANKTVVSVGGSSETNPSSNKANFAKTVPSWTNTGTRQQESFRQGTNAQGHPQGTSGNGDRIFVQGGGMQTQAELQGPNKHVGGQGRNAQTFGPQGNQAEIQRNAVREGGSGNLNQAQSTNQLAKNKNQEKLGFNPSANPSGNSTPVDIKAKQADNESAQQPIRTNTKLDQNVAAGKLDIPIKEFCKNVAMEILNHFKPSDIIQAVGTKQAIPDDISQNEHIQKFIVKCFQLCWMMLAQYPPMVMDFTSQPGTPYNQALFEVYTTRGANVAYVVWPPVYLHKDGPVVCKGYVECIK